MPWRFACALIGRRLYQKLNCPLGRRRLRCTFKTKLEFTSKAEARKMSATELSAFGQRMSAHIRKEERQLFERLQQLSSQDELSRLGESLDEALKDAAQACA